MGVSKVDFGRTTLIDLTEDSVDAASLLRGKTAHNRAGDMELSRCRLGACRKRHTISGFRKSYLMATSI